MSQKRARNGKPKKSREARVHKIARNAERHTRPQLRAAPSILPNLFIPGAAKSGTSTLYDYLDLHPDICMCVNKEPSYFWRRDKRLDQFAKLFDDGPYRYYGESSTSYMMLPEVVQRIRRSVPDPRFVFVLRNPADRAWSHYRWIRDQYDAESRGFREAFHDDVGREPEAADFARSLNKHYYQVGRYAKWLRLYQDAFGRDRVHVLLFEHLVAAPTEQINAIFRFLGLAEIGEVKAIRSNPTTGWKRPGLTLAYARLSRAAGFATQDLLPGRMYRSLVRLNRRLSPWISGSRPQPPRPLSSDDRAWVASYYSDDVAQLRETTGLTLDPWAVDFPALTAVGARR